VHPAPQPGEPSGPLLGASAPGVVAVERDEHRPAAQRFQQLDRRHRPRPASRPYGVEPVLPGQEDVPLAFAQQDRAIAEARGGEESGRAARTSA
jgi:hypothetical protein